MMRLLRKIYLMIAIAGLIIIGLASCAHHLPDNAASLKTDRTGNEYYLASENARESGEEKEGQETTVTDGDEGTGDIEQPENKTKATDIIRTQPEKTTVVEPSTVTVKESDASHTATPASPESIRKAEELYNLGFQVYMAWKLDDAIKLFDRAIEIDPGCYKAYNGKGIVLCFKGNYDEGLKLIGKALDMKPDFVYANFNMALAYKLKKDYGKAMEWFNRALALDPKDTWSYFGIACIYAEQKDAVKAVEYLRKAIDTDPSVKDAARREKDLDPIRNDPEFIKLVK